MSEAKDLWEEAYDLGYVDYPQPIGAAKIETADCFGTEESVYRMLTGYLPEYNTSFFFWVENYKENPVKLEAVAYTIADALAAVKKECSGISFCYRQPESNG